MSLIKNLGLVSVVIPAYNAERYIADAIRSVLNQTYPWFEIIVVDDASQDKTAAVVESIKDGRIHLIRHHSNKGAGAARNTAIEAAKGRWIALLDADDAFAPQRLERFVELAESYGDGYFFADDLLLCFDSPSGMKPWGNGLRIRYKVRKTKNDEVIRLSLTEYLRLGAPGIHPFFPLEHIRRYGLRYSKAYSGQDFEFHCRVFKSGLKLVLIAEPLYLYRFTPGSLSSKAERFDHQIKVRERLLCDEGFTDEEKKLLKLSIKRLFREKEYQPFAVALKKREWTEAFRMLVGNPSLALRFMKRLPVSLRYRWNALRRGGVTR